MIEIRLYEKGKIIEQDYGCQDDIRHQPHFMVLLTS